MAVASRCLETAAVAIATARTFPRHSGPVAAEAMLAADFSRWQRRQGTVLEEGGQSGTVGEQQRPDIGRGAGHSWLQDECGFGLGPSIG
eukprot:g32276.t1